MEEKKRVIVFGASEGGKNYCKFQSDYKILAFTDNDKNKHGTTISNHLIIEPESMKDYDYDYIIIASVFYKEINQQLLNELQIGPDKIKVAPKGLMKSSYLPFEDKKTMEFARENLLKLTRLFTENDIKYFADFGTLLGIARDGDLISWDDDIDLSILVEDFEKVVVFFENQIRNFDLYDDIKCEIHATYNKVKNEPINISLSFKTDNLKPIRDFQINIAILTIEDELAVQSMNRSPKHHFEKQQQIVFWGEKISVPFEYESYLELTYGDWKTPRKNMSFEDYPYAYEDKIIPLQKVLY